MTSIHPSARDVFAGFSPLSVSAGGVQFSGVIGGSGAPLLLLHGFPQTHFAWRHVTPKLARDFTVVVPDLPGYGDSRVLDRSRRWTKRRVAEAAARLMEALGFNRFAVVGHDRGARAAYRLALDRPDVVSHLASLAVVPTLQAWQRADAAFGLANFHWFFLAQPWDLIERMLAAAPDDFIDAILARMAGGLDKVEVDALAAYRRAFRDESVRRAIIEDYRSGAEDDLADDRQDIEAGRKLHCPVLVSWPEAQASHSPLEAWRPWADDIRVVLVAGGHLQPEDRPREIVAALRGFLRSSTSPTP